MVNIKAGAAATAGNCSSAAVEEAGGCWGGWGGWCSRAAAPPCPTTWSRWAFFCRCPIFVERFLLRFRFSKKFSDDFFRDFCMIFFFLVFRFLYVLEKVSNYIHLIFKFETFSWTFSWLVQLCDFLYATIPNFSNPELFEMPDTFFVIFFNYALYLCAVCSYDVSRCLYF